MLDGTQTPANRVAPHSLAEANPAANQVRIPGSGNALVHTLFDTCNLLATGLSHVIADAHWNKRSFKAVPGNRESPFLNLQRITFTETC